MEDGQPMFDKAYKMSKGRRITNAEWNAVLNRIAELEKALAKKRRTRKVVEDGPEGS
jgi:hypothetical protein